MPDKFGNTMHRVEAMAEEFYEAHDMQLGEVLGAWYQYTIEHYPGAIEEYLDGSNPKFFYGPLESFVKLHRKEILEILS